LLLTGWILLTQWIPAFSTGWTPRPGVTPLAARGALARAVSAAGGTPQPWIVAIRKWDGGHGWGLSPYREMDPAAFGTMVSSLLLGLRDNRHGLLEKAATLLSIAEQEEASFRPLQS